MNDEPPPPQLRLKPRARPADEPPAAEAVAVVAPPKLRVKPRITPDVPAEVVAPVVEQSAGDPGAVPMGGLETSKFNFRAAAEAEAAVEAIVAEPEPLPEILPVADAEPSLEDPPPPTVESDDAPTFPADAVAEVPAAAAATPAPSDDPPVFPVMAPDLPTATDGSTLIGGLSSSATHPQVSQEAPPEQRKSFRYGVVGTTVALALVLSGGTYYILKHFFGAPTPPAAKIKVVKPAVTASALVKSAATSAPVLTPTATVKAKDLITSRRNEEQARVNALANGEEPSPSPSPRPAAHNASTSTVAASSVGRATLESSAPPAEPTTLAPGVTTQMGADVKATDASPEFRNFVASARITGVFQGSPARAFINGKLARTGDTIDIGLGVIFDHVDGSKKEIVFKDASGAVVARKY